MIGLLVCACVGRIGANRAGRIAGSGLPCQIVLCVHLPSRLSLKKEKKRKEKLPSRPLFSLFSVQFVRSWYRLSKRLLCNGLHWHSPPFLLACTSYVTPTHTNAQPVLSLLSTNQVRVAATGMNAAWGRGVSRGSRRNKILESTE